MMLSSILWIMQESIYTQLAQLVQCTRWLYKEMHKFLS